MICQSNRKRGLEKGVNFTIEKKPLQIQWEGRMEECTEFDSFARGKRRTFTKFFLDCLFFFSPAEERSFAERREGVSHMGLKERNQYLEEFLKEFIKN